jgi:hypothetical protein
MDESPNPDETEDPRAQRGLVGETGGGALRCDILIDSIGVIPFAIMSTRWLIFLYNQRSPLHFNKRL